MKIVIFDADKKKEPIRRLRLISYDNGAVMLTLVDADGTQLPDPSVLLHISPDGAIDTNWEITREGRLPE